MGIRKNTERIRLSFWRINIRKNVEDWIKSCEKCQLKRGWKKSDCVPITPIPRAEAPFQMMNMDCIYVETPGGPRKIKYCLHIVDSFSRWPTVYLLTS